MEEEEINEEKSAKHTSRKWIIAVWSMTLGTLIILFSGVCSLMDKPVPSWFGGVSTILIGTGVAYIGGNVWQKQIQAKEREQ